MGRVEGGIDRTTRQEVKFFFQDTWAERTRFSDNIFGFKAFVDRSERERGRERERERGRERERERGREAERGGGERERERERKRGGRGERERETETETETENSNSKTLFYKDFSLGLVKYLSNS